MTIRGYCNKAGEKLFQIYDHDQPFYMWMHYENWMGDLEFDEGTKMFERGAE